jgi:hypothetical protein
MKGSLNPPLKKGDRIVLFHMDGESAVSPGALGTVSHVGKDPFEDDGEIISVAWDNGSRLSLLTSTDAWKMAPVENIQENRSGDPAYEYFSKNPEVFDNFDWRFLRLFLYKIRKSGITNMFAASPLLYSGKNHIERYFGEGREDSEDFQAVLDDADEAKDKIVLGVINYMKKKGMDLDDLDLINSLARKFSQKILNLYISFS